MSLPDSPAMQPMRLVRYKPWEPAVGPLADLQQPLLHDCTVATIAQSVEFGDQLGLEQSMKSKRYGRCDMPTWSLRVTTVGDSPWWRPSVLQLVPECLGSTRTDPVRLAM